MTDKFYCTYCTLDLVQFQRRKDRQKLRGRDSERWGDTEEKTEAARQIETD